MHKYTGRIVLIIIHGVPGYLPLSHSNTGTPVSPCTGYGYNRYYRTIVSVQLYTCFNSITFGTLGTGYRVPGTQYNL